ncbi:MAG: hypothetical protein K5756_04070 [Clostridiales bacterium]|nr:hypothetical protein [Clostridiales bacterium]
MNIIKEWAIGITLISFAGGIVFILLPKSSTAKTVKSIIYILIILSCVIPFSGGKKIETKIFTESFNDSFEDSEFSRTVERQQLDFVEVRLKNEIEKILEKYSSKAAKICFDDNINSDGRIVINKVTVYLDKEYFHLALKIHNDILSVLGIDNSVIMQESKKSVFNENEVNG